MYVDAKPVSTFGETQGWSVPNQQPTGTMERSLPNTKQRSPSPFSDEMEHPVPSFQSFIDRTPPTNSSLQTSYFPTQHSQISYSKRAESEASRSPFGRRTSSVYSRASNWVPKDGSWQTADLAEEYSNLILRPIAYSASTSNLVRKVSDVTMLLPRMYSPLINSPSPTTSRSSTPSPPPSRFERPSVLLPPPPMVAHVATHHLRTVSLEKAKQALNAPGAIHLLPEELRAQTLGKARSQEPLRVDSFISPPELETPSTFVDNQGRERLISTQHESFGVSNQVASAENSNFEQGPPVPEKTGQVSQDKAMQALGIGEYEDSRGRTRQRGPRKLDYEHFLPQTQKPISTESDYSTDSEESDARAIAQEYHHMLAQHYRQPSETPTYDRADPSEESLRTQHSRLIPQPLFHAKPSSRRGTEASNYRFDGRNGSVADSVSSEWSDSFPLRLSLTPDSTRRRRRPSTSGSIPISPPSATMPDRQWMDIEHPKKEIKTQSLTKKRQSLDRPRPVSQYYPHVMSRKTASKKKQLADKKKGKQRPKISNPMDPSMSLLQASVTARQINTPETSAGISYISGQQHCGFSNPEDNNTFPRANPESPHLLPSPSKPAPSMTGTHLGWSDLAKASFDKARGIVNIVPSKPRIESQSSVKHVIGPARPLDERHTGSDAEGDDSDDEDGGHVLRRPSIFGEILEGWREGKKERRREELKKIIRVVPVGEEVRGGSVSSQVRPELRRAPGSGESQAISSTSGTPMSERESPFTAMGRKLSGYI